MIYLNNGGEFAPVPSERSVQPIMLYQEESRAGRITTALCGIEDLLGAVRLKLWL